MRTFFTRNDASNVTYKPFGNWEEAVRVFGNLSPYIKVSCIKAQEGLGRDILKRVKGHLIKQDLPWRPLTKAYLKRKKGWDSRILLSTHSYYTNIDIWRRSNGWSVFVGVKKGIYGLTPEGKKSKLDIATIAYIHEFSRKSNRRRPLWNPTVREMGNTPGIKAIFIKNLKMELRKSGLRKYLYITNNI